MSERRALLTDREREIIAGEADVKDSYRYQTISRVRSRFDRLESDLEVFREHGGLLEELQEIVCNDVEPKTRESHSTPAERSPVEDTVSPEPQQERQENEQQPREIDSAIDHALEGWKPGQGGTDTERRRQIGRQNLEWLRDRPGKVQKADFVNALYERTSLEGQGEKSWWERVVRPGLDHAAEQGYVDNSGRSYSWVNNE